MSGNGIHSNKSALQQDGVYDLPSTEYELVGPHPSCNDTLLEFDNPLYSDVGPVTFTETNTYESVSCQQLLPLYAYMSHRESNTFPCLLLCRLSVEHLLLQESIPMFLLW